MLHFYRVNESKEDDTTRLTNITYRTRWGLLYSRKRIEFEDRWSRFEGGGSGKKQVEVELAQFYSETNALRRDV